MSHWWRAHDEAVDDPKLQLLSDAHLRAWFNVMCLSSANGGIVPPLAHVAFKLRMTPPKAAKVLEALTAAGLLDKVGDNLQPHNWNARQFKSDVSTERVKQHRERQRNVSPPIPRNVSGTPPDNREQITDSEPSSLRSEVACAREAPVDRSQFEGFWRVYPHKVGKQAAYKAFVKSMKSGAIDLDRMMFSLTAYINKTDDRPWCNPATWLNEGRWDDQPAPEVRNGRSLLAAAERNTERLGGREAAAAYVPGSEKPKPLGLDFGEVPADIQRLPSR